MEAFAFLKFWKSTAKVAIKDDDSFFELELTSPIYDSKFPNPDHHLTSKISLNSNTNSSPNRKPHSPMSSFFRSASPRLRFFAFKKRKQDEFDTASVSSSSSSSSSSDFESFTVKFEIEDGSIVPRLSSSTSRISDECYESSKRFSKEVIQKYFSRIKPLYVKSPKRTEKFVAPRNSASFPSLKVKCKQLAKSKSASAVIGAPSPAILPARSEHPSDCIESAILHCKRSLNSGYSSLSRCSSDPSHEKSIHASDKI